jgi:hypothetical protein
MIDRERLSAHKESDCVMSKLYVQKNVRTLHHVSLARAYGMTL